MSKQYVAVVCKSSDDFEHVYEVIGNSLEEAADLEDKLFYESECCNTCVSTSWQWKCSEDDIEKIEELVCGC